MKNLCCLSLFFLFLSCNAKYEVSFLEGQWKMVEWANKESGEKINGQMDFTFNSEMRYSVDYGSQEEKGKYWLAGEYLHTVEDGMAEKKVLIVQLTRDSLSFEMNRGGQIEVVSLIKS